MPIYSYAYASGFDATVLTNIEDVIPNMPTGGIKGQIVPLGSTRRRTLNQYVVSNGTREVKWFLPALRSTDFAILIIDMFGDFDTENAEQTIDSRASDENFHRYNVVTNRPIEGTDYTRREYGDVEDLTITHRIIEEVGNGGGFSIGFSLGFEG